MGFDSLVLVKQVPDTAEITGQVMRADGTVNRAKLPAIFNPEDRVALELALRVRDQHGGKVTALTMGPSKASDLLRECLFMGADEVFLVTDRKFAGADTLATSYVLSKAVEKLGAFDLIFAGRQAIDGDTAQVGPQTAEKLGLPQITCVEELLALPPGEVIAKRRIDGGHEVLRARLPVLLTVIKEAAVPRPFKATRVMAYKNARSLSELEKLAEANPLLYVDALTQEYMERKLYIPTLSADDLGVELDRCGLMGSPTKVKSVDSVVLTGGEHEHFPPTKDGLGRLIDRLMHDHLFG
ncbi:MAG: electron transfer flavoprotein subunit beta/FixA family protein [Deltaproteobacteria bacterium]|nr:electron transfer flavoprotein subunit beta/FixA family protein [Deltaproteobacteria bacterium]